MNESKLTSTLKSKVDSRLQRIANVLLLNASFIDNLGLLNGKMGIAIFFYHYSRYTGNKIFEDYAGELIDEIYEEINTNTPEDFANGLTGIGWGIEYLVKNGFVEADTDEALALIDKPVYQSSLNRPFLLNNTNDLFGYGFYFISRLQERDKDNNNQNSLNKKQHLIYLTDQCEQILVQKRYSDFNIQSLSIDTINSFAWFLLEMHRLGQSPKKVEKLFHSLPGYIELCLQDSDDKSGQSLLLKLAENIITSVADKVLQKTFRTIVKKKNGKIPYKDTSEEVMVDNFTKNAWQKLVYATYITDSKSFQEDAGKLFSIIDNEENWNRQLDHLNKNNIGLTGFASLGWGILSLKELLKN